MQIANTNELPGLGKIYAGEVHFSRIPVQYWEHRILMIKALGLNALSIYIMWNYHQVSRGVFDFQTDNKNLPHFLDLAHKHNMMVLFRPGPYVCAEWDFGGMPARLLSIDGLVIRSTNPQFLKQTYIWFQALVPIMKKYLRTAQNPKGCIVMLQIQNQYGFYGTDKSYIQAIRGMWKDLGIHTHQYYVDWSLFVNRCHWEGAHIGINNFSKSIQQTQVRLYEKKGIIMGGQIYTGWMTHWTEKWGGKDIEKVVSNFRFLIQNGNSFAMYVVHGGTNFGLTAGANGLNWSLSDYWGALTSYDYDAPINQQGAVTQKYLQLRQLFKKYVKWDIPQIPQQIPMITINEFYPSKHARLFDNFPSNVVKGDSPYPFESYQLQMFNQGMVLYQTQIQKQENTYIKMVIHDFALVYLGNKLLEVLDRTKYTNHGFTIKKSLFKQHGRKLRILVEASGHINFDKNMETDRKGIYYFGGDLKEQDWLMYKYPVEFSEIIKWHPVAKISMRQVEKPETPVQDFPIVLTAQITLSEVGDTYLDMSRYGKGYVWVNGHNLGRYWNIGPQQRLFCPGCWLKIGINNIHILNVWGPSGGPIAGYQKLRDIATQLQSKCSIM